MNNTKLLMLLFSISKKTSVSNIIGSDFTYSQLAMLLSEANRLGYISQQNGDIELTEAGTIEMSNLLNERNLHKKKNLILPQYDNRTKPIKKYDIVLPDKIL
ncbi:MAG TPA: hypothetical protein VN538_06565 [Clostridia bacterium]|nr:hypothetical protein [Clostridia bacterium]